MGLIVLMKRKWAFFVRYTLHQMLFLKEGASVISCITELQSQCKRVHWKLGYFVLLQSRLCKHLTATGYSSSSSSSSSNYYNYSFCCCCYRLQQLDSWQWQWERGLTHLRQRFYHNSFWRRGRNRPRLRSSWRVPNRRPWDTSPECRWPAAPKWEPAGSFASSCPVRSVTTAPRNNPV